MCSLRKFSCEDEVLLEQEDVTEEKYTIAGPVFVLEGGISLTDADEDTF